MKKGIIVMFVFLAIFVGGIAFAQNPFEKTTEPQALIDKTAMSTMDKYADQDKEKLATFLKQEKHNHVSVSYVSAKQALEEVNKIGRQKVMVDKTAIPYNGRLIPNYVIVIPE